MFPAPVAHRILIDADVYAVRRTVRFLATAVGFNQAAQGELVIVASELASNILKYGVTGEIVTEIIVEEARGPGIRLSAHDTGPPIRDFETALRDGWTDGGPIDGAVLLRRGGIGAGLGAISRFSDELIYEPSESGKTIIVQRFVRRAPRKRPIADVLPDDSPQSPELVRRIR